MKKLLSPQQKKHYSYQKDCRNCYGENDKGSRKIIPKNKQYGHKQERHLAHDLLIPVRTIDEYEVEEMMGKFQGKVKAKRLKAFKKCPDLPLGKMLEHRFLFKKPVNTLSH